MHLAYMKLAYDYHNFCAYHNSCVKKHQLNVPTEMNICVYVYYKYTTERIKQIWMNSLIYTKYSVGIMIFAGVIVFIKNIIL